MPPSLCRYQQGGHLHFITFSCYRRQPKLGTSTARAQLEESLEQTRRSYGLGVLGYVVMPEHVHLLVSEPEKGELSIAIQALKQSVSRRLALRSPEPFWQARYYDFNVWSGRKRVEKLRYIHRNPVARGLVTRPEDWKWSSYLHYLTGVEGIVEIESEWTARRREQMGIRLRAKVGPVQCFPP
ncbi:MAG: transposase [Candidatus Sulfotelmatobacter sp.]